MEDFGDIRHCSFSNNGVITFNEIPKETIDFLTKMGECFNKHRPPLGDINDMTIIDDSLPKIDGDRMLCYCFNGDYWTIEYYV